MDKEDIRSTLQSLSGHVAREFHADIEGFFGSRARGDARNDSDLDVLVRFGEMATLYDLVGLADYLESVLDCRVDIVSTRALDKDVEPQIRKDLVSV